MTQNVETFIHYVLETQHSGVAMRLLLNGFELVRAAPTDKKIISERINGWLMGGENKIKIYASIPDIQHPVDPVNLKCLLFRGPAGRQPEESEALLRFAQDDKTKLPHGTVQVVWETSFKAEPFYGPWLWESSLPIVLGPSAAESALGVIRAVLNALNSHNGEEVVKLFRVYVDEISRAYKNRPERMEADLKGWAEIWTFATPVPAASEYSIRVEENGRLLSIERKDGLALFTVDPKIPATGPKRVYLTNAPMGWTIVR